jgi:hypothetical protein
MTLEMLLQTTATLIPELRCRILCHTCRKPFRRPDRYRAQDTDIVRRTVSTGQNRANCQALGYGKYWSTVNSATCRTAKLIGVGAHILTMIIMITMMIRKQVVVVTVGPNLHHHFF